MLSTAESMNAGPLENTGTPQGGITEIIQHSTETPLTPLLLPMLAHLSRGQNWVALVAPPGELDRATLQAAGVDLEKVWVLRPNREHDAVDLTARAMLSTTCETVICWHRAGEDRALESLYTLASQSTGQCILLRGR
ncbi:MAG: cell division inhibitor [Oceanospirillaceae bacterium]|jgi:cell division inhibitor SulA|nr:cell division inhibitor [Oceanospirillaceae bacterium]